MGKGEKQAEVAERIKELHKQYDHGRLTTTTISGSIKVKNGLYGYKIRDEFKPHCEECDQEVTVEHMIWQCTTYNSQRRRNSITKNSMGDNKEETGRLIKYLKETGLLYSI
jgi:adenylate kinase family enzyme